MNDKRLTFDALQREYAALWAGISIRPEKRPEVMATARRILANRPRYDEVSRKTGVPWYVIGIIHSLECGLSFDKHLHNGDLLRKAGKPIATTRVPAKRGPFQTWDESAIDALTMPGKQFDRIRDWSPERIAWCLELYNGFGYRLYRRIHSPYLWSFTTAYSSGKYVADGVWSPTAVSSQVGSMALLAALVEIDAPQVDLRPPAIEVADVEFPKAEAAPASVTPPPKISVAARSKSVWALVLAAGTWVVEKTMGLVELIPTISTDVDGIMAPLGSLAAAIKLNVGPYLPSITVGLIAIALWRHTRDKQELETARQVLGTSTADDETKGA